MKYEVRTDLAREARELNPEIAGVEEETYGNGAAAVSRITIVTDEAAIKLGKKKGTYITIDSPDLEDGDREAAQEAARLLCRELRTLLPPDGTVFVAGLGNRSVTPDSLGPRVVDKLMVTRHITMLGDEITDEALRPVCAAAPGVLGVTGIETADMLTGICSRVEPAAVVLVDALASRRAERMSSCIQLSDAGLSPGGGVGNMRAEISRSTLGVPVVAVGVPTEVFASTIAHDAIDAIVKASGQTGGESLEALLETTFGDTLDVMIMTAKEIDAIIESMSGIVAEGINRALHGSRYDTVIEITE